MQERPTNKPDLQTLPARAKQAAPSTKKLFERLKKTKPAMLDQIVHGLHEEAFERISCLDCANCCKTISPAFYQRDIERLARHFRIRPAQFIGRYLKLDEEKEYVLQFSPCPFLGADNYCSVYEARPDACRDYPHTDRRRFYQLLPLTLKNTEVCPAVFEIVEKLKGIGC